MKISQTSYQSRLLYKMTAKDWIIHLSVTPGLVVLANYWLLGPVYFTNTYTFLSTTFIGSIIATGLTVSNMRSMFASRSKYPDLNQTGKRLLTAFSLYLLADFFGCILLLLWYDYLPSLNFTITINHFVKTSIILLVSAVIGGLGYEFFYSFEKWKESIVENEKLQRLQAQTELSVLKSQVNPHFLFNSLNSLSSLISDDSERAEIYLNEMTKVYRYLIRNNELELTSLANEIKFINSYFHLLKTRHGQGIELHLSIMPQHENYLLPSLTLQLLVENAVKHNTVLKEQPLILKLFTNSKNELILTNNLQKKKLQVDSTKIGLSNIASKYRLLRQPDIQIQQTDTAFTVILPLISNQASIVSKAVVAINA